jgi:CRP-like cAMP-binding protein
LQPRFGKSLETALTVAPSRDREGKVVALHWSLRDLTKDQQALTPQEMSNIDLGQLHPKFAYHKGEIIPLEPASLWLVCQGWVKLSTIAENGEQVLVGLAGPSMPFGSGITSLPTYQATALSEEVQLISLSLAEIDNSSDLRKTVFPQIIQRLQQTEFLLAISGVRQTQERLHHLLAWLKENFGQKVAKGYRLSVRLIHQELADTCGTTRVTISRLLSQLKKQGRIIYDRDRHIILLD